MREWRFVPELEDLFIVSNDGKVFSVRTEKILKTHLSKTGYYTFSTYIGGRGGKAKLFRVHRLVASAFIKNNGNKPFVNHIDGVKTNNCSSNLEWVTTSENLKHAYGLGLINTLKRKQDKDLKNPLFLMTKEQVDFVKAHYKKGDRIYGALALSKLLKVSRNSIRTVVRNYNL